MDNAITNAADVIDSRDVIARKDELTGELYELASAVITARQASGDRSLRGTAPAGDAVREALAALEDWKTEHHAELEDLTALAEDCEGYGDWEHGETLIRYSYFTEYCREMLEDCGTVPADIPAFVEIDWDATARNLKADYMTVDFDGIEYLIRT